MSSRLMSKPLLALLLLTLVLSIVSALMPAPEESPSDDADLLTEPRERTSAAAQARNPFLRAGAGAKTAPPTAGFVTVAQQPVAPPPPPPAPPPVQEVMPAEPPGPPAVPFAYLGQLQEDDRTVLFIQVGEDAVAVTPGDKLSSTWQLDSTGEDLLVFRHLPTQQTQTLRIAP